MSEKTSQRWVEVEVRAPGRVKGAVEELLGLFSDVPVRMRREGAGGLWLVTGRLLENASVSTNIKAFDGALRQLEAKERLSDPLAVDLAVVSGSIGDAEGLIYIGDRFVIFPSGKVDKPVEGRIPLPVVAMHAFGDGNHPSTILSLCLLEQVLDGRLGGIPKKGWVLDAGCGTGILSLAASAMGGLRVLGVDVSPDAILAAKENQKKNSVADGRLRFVLGGYQCCRGPFGLILANLVASVHTGACASLWDAAEPGGWFVLAGFSLAQKELVTAPYLERGAEEMASLDRHGWAGVALRKPSRGA